MAVTGFHPLDPVIVPRGVGLIGQSHADYKGPVPRTGAGTKEPTPAGDGFIVTDRDRPLLTLRGNNRIEGLGFWYPEQNYGATTRAEAIVYPATIRCEDDERPGFQSARVVACNWTGAWRCIEGGLTQGCQDFVIEENYAYPLSGCFLELHQVYDIARVNGNHINPGSGATLLGDLPYSPACIDMICREGEPTFRFHRFDELMAFQNFAFGVNCFFHVTDSYGSVVQCQADMVETGIVWDTGAESRKYGKIVACNILPSAGPDPSRRAAFVARGGGHVALIGCHAFLGTNKAVPSTSDPNAAAFLRVESASASSDAPRPQIRLHECRAGQMSGQFDLAIDNRSPDADVQWFDFVQDAVRAEGRLPTTRAADVDFGGAQVDRLRVTDPSALEDDGQGGKRLAVMVGGENYYVTLTPASSSE